MIICTTRCSASDHFSENFFRTMHVDVVHSTPFLSPNQASSGFFQDRNTLGEGLEMSMLGVGATRTI